MKKRYIVAVLLLGVNLFGFAQFNFKKLATEIGNGAISGKLDKVIEDQKKAFVNSKTEYETTNLNYAISLSDNAGLFESKERFGRQKNMLIAIVQNTDEDGITPLEQASQYKDAGQMLYANGKYNLAEKSFLKANTIYVANNQQKSKAYALLVANLGLLYHSMGRYEKSEKLTLEATEILKEILGDTSAAQAACINNLGVLYKDMGKYNEAETFLAKALARNKTIKGDKSMPYAIVLNNKAMLNQMVGRTKQAETELNLALNIVAATLGEKSNTYLQMYVNLALLYQDLGQYPASETIYKKVIALKERRLGTGHPDYAHYLNGLASLYVLMGKDGEVEELLKKSASIYKNKLGENSPAYAESISDLGNFYRIKNRNQEANNLLNQSAQIRKETLGENHPTYINAQFDLALINWQMQKIEEAAAKFNWVFAKTFEQINYFFASMSEVEKSKYWDKIRPKFETYNSFVIANTAKPELLKWMYEYHINTKGILLTATNKIKQQILDSKDQDLIQNYKSWLENKEQLCKLYTYTKEELAEDKINLDSLENATNTLEKQLSARSNLFISGKTKFVTTENIQAVLKTEEASLEIIQFRKFDNRLQDEIKYVGLILSKSNQMPTIVVLDNGNELETKCYKYYKNNIKLKSEDERSFVNYWEKINTALNPYKKVYFSVDGIYNQININTIQLPSGKFVIEDKSIINLANSKDLLNQTPNSLNKDKTAILVGNPYFGAAGTIPALMGTKKEVESINLMLKAHVFTTKLYFQKDASEVNIKKIINPKWLHIATHGFFVKTMADDKTKLFGISNEKAKENPLLRSGLMLANAESSLKENADNINAANNGILTAYEVSNMSLDKTDMVVLSACETGLGDVKMGEGVYGLQRAFLVAGAQTLVMSLWTVSDEATQLLMTSFYKKLLSGTEKNIAFRAAQLELKTKYPAPYYWGAFVMIN
jgi:CHAT domain-containing protein